MKTLRKEAGIKVGDPVDPNAIEEARRKIEDFYHHRGYNNALVTLWEGGKPTDRRAIFLIDEGVKQTVWRTDIIGNTIDSTDRLLTQISTKHPFLYLFGGEFDRKKLDEDVEKLTDYYRRLGFYSARIGRELSYNEKGDWVTITFVIDEGPRYKIRNVSVIGNKKYTEKELLADLTLKNNEYFNRDSLTADVRTLQDKYGSVGYVFADVKPEPRFLENPRAQLDLVYNISEGDRYRVGKINIRIKGDYSHTQENTVRNRLFFKPGDIVDIREIRASEVALKRSRLFENTPADAPKIVFSPPGQERNEDDDLAERPAARSGRGSGRHSGGMGRGMGSGPGSDSGDGSPTFRGQSPDSDSHDRVLDLTLDCGCYIGSPENAASATPQQPTQPQTVVASAQEQASLPRPSSFVASTASVSAQPSSDLAQSAREYTEALARAKQERTIRPQYLAPDDTWDGQRSVPRNLAPGDVPAPQHQSRDDSTADLGRTVREYSEALSAAKTGQQSRGRLIPTQYSPNGGQVNPAGNVPLQWSSSAPPTTSNTDNSAAAAAPAYPAPGPQPYVAPTARLCRTACTLHAASLMPVGATILCTAWPRRTRRAGAALRKQHWPDAKSRSASGGDAERLCTGLDLKRRFAVPRWSA